MKINNKNLYVEFTIKGNNFENLLNILNYRNIIIKKFKIIDKNQVKFKTLKTNTKKIIDLLKNSCYTFNVREIKNSIFYVNAISKNIGFTLALGMFVLLSIFYSQYIWNIKIICEDTQNAKLVENYLRENKITIGSNKSLINRDDLENNLMQINDVISQVDISYYGATLIVNVKNKIVNNIVSKDFKPIISEYDGELIRLNIESGSSEYKVGDKVRKGDILVAPYRITEYGEKQLCIAKGEIEINAYEQESVFYDENGESLNNSGESKTFCGLKFNNTNFYKGETPNFKRYEIVQKEVKFSKIIPISIVYTTYHKLEYTKNTKTFEEVREELINKCEGKFESKLTNAQRIENITNHSQGKYVITITYKALVKQSC